MASQTQSIFFRLPAELRNQIYQELLCAGTPRPSQLHQYAQERHHSSQPTIYPSILLTCKRIHSEAQDLLYSTHIFHAHPSLLTSLPHLVSPLKPLLSPTAIAKIRRWHVSLRLDTDPQFTEAQATKAFSGAEYLEIQAWQSMFDGCDDSVLGLFKGVRGVKVAKVTGCVEEGVARWLESRMVLPVEEEKEEEMGEVGQTCGGYGRKMEWRQIEGGFWTLGGCDRGIFLVREMA
ncbi:hypothetical protein yc1106_09214 [Curvularia clavata]|uniref:DUF7730 domain-containing protein n=1 Tax=Curvularia clavata TaxID=95742 RepID=A0A9Q9DXH1_CURCL|nr:hypothetical protein yc1106_09214 [Curvularia clavata]